jgi:hypothetical protein
VWATAFGRAEKQAKTGINPTQVDLQYKVFVHSKVTSKTRTHESMMNHGPEESNA